MGVFTLLKQEVVTVFTYKGAPAGKLQINLDNEQSMYIRSPTSPNQSSTSSKVFQDLKQAVVTGSSNINNVLLWFGCVDIHLNYFNDCLEANTILDFEEYASDILDSYFEFIGLLTSQFEELNLKVPRITLLGIVLPTLDQQNFVQGLCKYLQILDNQKQYVQAFFDANKYLQDYDYRVQLVKQFNGLLKQRAESQNINFKDITSETFDDRTGQIANKYKTKFQKNIYLNWEHTLPIWFKKLGKQYAICSQNLIKPFEETEVYYQTIKSQKEENTKVRKTLSAIPSDWVLQMNKDKTSSNNEQNQGSAAKSSLIKHNSLSDKFFQTDRRLQQSVNAPSWRKSEGAEKKNLLDDFKDEDIQQKPYSLRNSRQTSLSSNYNNQPNSFNSNSRQNSGNTPTNLQSYRSLSKTTNSGQKTSPQRRNSSDTWFKEKESAPTSIPIAKGGKEQNPSTPKDTRRIVKYPSNAGYLAKSMDLQKQGSNGSSDGKSQSREQSIQQAKDIALSICNGENGKDLKESNGKPIKNKEEREDTKGGSWRQSPSGTKQNPWKKSFRGSCGTTMEQLPLSNGSLSKAVT